MADHVLRMVTPATMIDDDIVSLLERTLERAKAGEFGGLALVAITRDGGHFSSFSGSEDRMKLIGALSFVQFRQMRAYDDDN